LNLLVYALSWLQLFLGVVVVVHEGVIGFESLIRHGLFRLLPPRRRNKAGTGLEAAGT